MSRTKIATVTPKETAASLAVALVSQWFDELSTVCMAPGYGGEDALDQAHIAVQEKCLDEHIAENGKPKDEEDKATYDEIAAARAGYLIGVQVGLRLRTAGGAR